MAQMLGVSIFPTTILIQNGSVADDASEVVDPLSLSALAQRFREQSGRADVDGFI